MIILELKAAFYVVNLQPALKVLQNVVVKGKTVFTNKVMDLVDARLVLTIKHQKGLARVALVV